MANKSPTTKHHRFWDIVLTTLSWLITLGPMIVYIIIGFIGGAVVSKVILGLTTIAAIVIFAIAALQKTKLRSPFWLIVIGLSFCLNEVYGMLIFTAASTIVDEMILSPLAKYHHDRYVINDQIDKRL